MLQDLAGDWRGWTWLERTIVSLATGLSLAVIVLGII
jgi:hypothetical protein